MRSAFSLIKSAELNLIVIVSETRHGGEGIHCANVIDSDLFNSSFSFVFLLHFPSISSPFPAVFILYTYSRSSVAPLSQPALPYFSSFSPLLLLHLSQRSCTCACACTRSPPQLRRCAVLFDVPTHWGTCTLGLYYIHWRSLRSCSLSTFYRLVHVFCWNQ